jgi:carbonic anhydrase/acetyltransferase-like protein (isoleucine patch superfamily)
MASDWRATLLRRCESEGFVDRLVRRAIDTRMPIYALGDLVPNIHADAFVHPDAVIIGAVTIGAGSSIWPCAVLRADQGTITVGERTSIQDGTVIHTTPNPSTVIGDDCVIGHMVHLEGCTIESGSLVGNGSIVLHWAIVRSGSLVGSNAVVPNKMEVPSGAMALGVPAKIRENCVVPEMISLAAASYVANGKRFKAEMRRID